MRAVLDPSVLTSAVLARDGAPAKVLGSWLGGAYELVVSEKLLSELERALAYPKVRKRLASDEAAEVVELLGRHAEHADDPRDGPKTRSADPGDDYLIALAGATRAVLVSGDRHLLALSDRLPVYSPRAFLDLLERGA